MQPTLAARCGCSDYFVVDNMVYMGTVNNSICICICIYIACIDICVVHSNSKQVRKC